VYTIYLITRNDDLQYVGLTTGLNRRISSHRYSKRFKKLGIKKVEILDVVETEEEAILQEIYFISQYDTYINGLNMTPHGGTPGKTTEEKFNTRGMSFTKGSTWYNNGKTNIRISEGTQPAGYVRGKLTRNPRNDVITEETREKMSKSQKLRKHRAIKLTEEQVLEIFNTLKSAPELPDIGKSRDLTNSTKVTYLRKFCQTYHKKYNVEEFYLFALISKKGYNCWNHLWKTVFGDDEPIFEKNVKPPSLTYDQVVSLFTTYEKNKADIDQNEICIAFAKKHNLNYRLCIKLIMKKGGKRWANVYASIVNDSSYKKNNKITEDNVRSFFSDFLKSSEDKTTFAKRSKNYGIGEASGRKLLVSKNKEKWQQLWEDVIDEHRNIN
jgi:hypothetical protein